MNTKPDFNIETRISNRAKSIFAAFGQVINDFYLEAGIYFVGGFNAALVAWDIFTDLTTNGQPLPYAIAIAIIAFVAVEGLAVYLVGAAAKTNNGLLWFFSVVFASFFTYAHYQEMTARAGIIAQYITLAIPFFVVVGYWARTVKIETENNVNQMAEHRNSEAGRQRQIEDQERQRQIEDREHQRQIEDQKLAHELEMDRLKLDQEQVQKMAQIEVQKVQKMAEMNQMNRQNNIFGPANGVRKNKKVSRQNDLVELMKVEPNSGPTELTKRLNEMGHTISVSQVKRDIKSLNGSMAS
jgi:hypothetical protein